VLIARAFTHKPVAGQYYHSLSTDVAMLVSNKLFKVHQTPELFFGRDETLQHLHKEFDNIISIWYF